MKELFLILWIWKCVTGPQPDGTNLLCLEEGRCRIETKTTSSVEEATQIAIEHKDDGVRVFRINHERTCNKELCFNTMSLNSTELELKELPRFELKEKK